VLLSVSIVAAAAGCQPAAGPTVMEYRQKSQTLKNADAEGVLRIGVQEGVPFMSEHDLSTDRWTGFDIEIARLIAYELGFTQPGSYKFVALTTEKRISALQSGEVHMVVADFTITPPRQTQVRFAGPYLVAVPEVMVRAADQEKIKTIDDLKKVRVCTTGGSTTHEMLEELDIAHSLVSKGADCVDGLRSGIYDAHCTDDVVIAGRVQRFKDEFVMKDMPFAYTERLGIGIPLDDAHLEGLVAHYLRKQLALGAKSQWQAAYNATLYHALGPRSQPQLLPGYPALADHDDKALAIGNARRAG
jgi:glutamate transport system substrate-binding protein